MMGVSALKRILQAFPLEKKKSVCDQIWQKNEKVCEIDSTVENIRRSRCVQIFLQTYGYDKD